MVVPFPSCPKTLWPQHLTAPPLVSAQLWRLPAAIALTPLCSPETSTGVELSVVVPSPSCPAALSPQHLTAPAARQRAAVDAAGGDRGHAALQPGDVDRGRAVSWSCRSRAARTRCRPST